MRRLVGLSFLIATSSLAAPPAVMTAGLWEITIRTESAVETPPMTTLVCVAPEEADRLAPPKGGKPTDDCKVIEGGLAGNVLSYAVKCGKRKVSTKGRFTYSGDRYEGVVDITSDEGTVRQLYSAKRIGVCENDVEVHP